MTSETFLTEGPLTVEEIVDAIRTQSLDEEAHHTFSDAQIKLALRQAILNSKGKFFSTDDTTIDYVAGELGPYTLPSAVDRVVKVTRARSSVVPAPTLTGVSTKQVVQSFEHKKTWIENEITFTRDYLSGEMTILFETDIRVPIDERAVDGDHTAVVTTLTLTDSAPYLWNMSLPTYARWDTEVVKITAISGNTSATIARAQMGTTATTHDAGSLIQPLVLADSPHLYSYLFSEMGRLLNQWRVQAGNRNTEVAANITATRMFKEDSVDALRNVRQPRRTSFMTFRRTRRPRRRF